MPDLRHMHSCSKCRRGKYFPGKREVYFPMTEAFKKILATKPGIKAYVIAETDPLWALNGVTCLKCIEDYVKGGSHECDHCKNCSCNRCTKGPAAH